MLHQLRPQRIFLKSHDYTPLGSLHPLARSRTGIKIVIILCIVITLAVTMSLLGAGDGRRGLRILTSRSSSADNPVPSIIDYVYIKNDTDSIMSVPFASFFTLFASAMYIKPTQIYIHTDCNDTEIRNASVNGDRWTRHHCKGRRHLPGLGRRAPASLTTLLNAGSTFMGGYGQDEDGSVNSTINNGAFLKKPNSTMARIMVREQHTRFDGAWAANPRPLLNTLFPPPPPKRSPHPGPQALRTDPLVGLHSSLGTDALFRPHPDRLSPIPDASTPQDPMELYERIMLNRRRRAEWEMDFSSTTSNCVVATYDAVKKMKADGLIGGDEDEKEPGKSGELEFEETRDVHGSGFIAISLDGATGSVNSTEVKDALS
ncbi:hypothetical protein SVAN01_08370 [Stagonosporopsis vannaccii]|nr:hypothetical protein SVAN01_08370 [Stagonosporopsis vannaccii]